MSKRKAYESDIDDLIEFMNDSMVLDSSEYDALMTAFKSKITDKDIENTIQNSGRRYVRYLRAEILAGYRHIETKINMYLQKSNDITRHMYIRFLEMKEIDELIVEAIEESDEKHEYKRQRKGNDTDSEYECEQGECDCIEIDV